MPQENLEIIFETASRDWDNLGSFDEFAQRMQNPENRQAFHSTLEASGKWDTLGTLEEFETRLGVAPPGLPDEGPESVIPEFTGGIRPPWEDEGPDFNALVEGFRVSAAKAKDEEALRKEFQAEGAKKPGQDLLTGLPKVPKPEMPVPEPQKFPSTFNEYFGREVTETLKKSMGPGGLFDQLPRHFLGNLGKAGVNIADYLYKGTTAWMDLDPETRKATEADFRNARTRIDEFTGTPEGFGGYAGATIGALAEFITEMGVGKNLLAATPYISKVHALLSKLPANTKFAQVARFLLNKAATETPVFAAVEALRDVDHPGQGALQGVKMALTFSALATIPGGVLSLGTIARVPLGNYMLGTNPVETKRILADESVATEDKMKRLFDSAVNTWFSKTGWTKKSVQGLHAAILLDYKSRGEVPPEPLLRSLESSLKLAPEKPEPVERKPLIRTIDDKGFPNLFLHGTKRKSIRTLTTTKPLGTREVLTDFTSVIPSEFNEFGAVLLLSEPRQPQQAHMFAQGKGRTLAAIKVKSGTKVLDLSDEIARAPYIALGKEPRVLRFFERPAITDDFIAWHKERISEGYKERHLDWKRIVERTFDPVNPKFDVVTWQENLVDYAKARGWGLIRFADETLVTNKAVLESARGATSKEIKQAETTKTYPGGAVSSLFTDKPTGARKEFEQRGLKEPAEAVPAPEPMKPVRKKKAAPTEPVVAPKLTSREFRHGTDMAEATGIIQTGLRAGSSVSKGPGWDYPVNLVFKGAPLEHNLRAIEHHPDHYIFSGKAELKRVEVDVSQYDMRSREQLERALNTELERLEREEGISPEKVGEATKGFLVARRLFRAIEETYDMEEMGREHPAVMLEKLKVVAKKAKVELRIIESDPSVTEPVVAPEKPVAPALVRPEKKVKVPAPSKVPVRVKAAPVSDKAVLAVLPKVFGTATNIAKKLGADKDEVEKTLERLEDSGQVWAGLSVKGQETWHIKTHELKVQPRPKPREALKQLKVEEIPLPYIAYLAQKSHPEFPELVELVARELKRPVEQIVMMQTISIPERATWEEAYARIVHPTKSVPVPKKAAPVAPKPTPKTLTGSAALLKRARRIEEADRKWKRAHLRVKDDEIRKADPKAVDPAVLFDHLQDLRDLADFTKKAVTPLGTGEFKDNSVKFLNEAYRLLDVVEGKLTKESPAAVVKTADIILARIHGAEGAVLAEYGQLRLQAKDLAKREKAAVPGKPPAARPPKTGVSVLPKGAKPTDYDLRYSGMPLPTAVTNRIDKILRKLTGTVERGELDRTAWKLVHEYYRKKEGVEFRNTEKWRRQLRTQFTPEEREDMIFYRQRTGNIFKKDDTPENVEKRLSTRAKVFVDKVVDEHIRQWREMWNRSPFTKDIKARKEVIKIYLTGVYTKNVDKAFDKVVARYGEEFAQEGPRGRRFVTDNFMGKKKKYLTYEEAFTEAGLIPRYRDLADLMNFQDSHMIRLLANNELVGEIRKTEKELGAPLIVINRGKRGAAKEYQEKKAEGWVEFDDPFLRKYPYGKDKKGKTVWHTTDARALIHPELAPALKSIFAREAYRPEHWGWRGYDAATSYLRYARVSFSGFHFIPLAESFVGAKGLGALNFPHWIRQGRKLLQDEVFMEEALGAGLKVSHGPREASRHIVERNVKSIINRLEAGHGLKRFVAKPIKAAAAVPFGITRAMFDIYLPVLKVNVYEHYRNQYTEHLRKKGVELDAEGKLRLNQQIASVVNDQFGVQAWELMRTLNDPKIQKWLHRIVGYPDWCEIGNTRIMTKTGWKYHHELSIGDEVMAFDPDTQKLKWSRLRDKYVNENYTGKMVQVKNWNRSITMTPDHTCYVVHGRSKKLSIIEAKDLIADHLIPRVADFDTPTEETYDDYFIKIVGWTVTDGHILQRQRKRKDGTRGDSFVGKITQSKPHTVAVLKDLGLSYYVDKNNYDHDKFIARHPKHMFNIPTKIVAELREIGIDENDKSLSWEFLSKLTHRQLKLLYDTMFLGDGTGQGRFCGREKEVFYMTMIQIMLGYPSTFYQQEENCWRTRHIKSKNISCHRKTVIDYSGTVWCPSVDTGFWLAENRGLVYITGNTISALRQAGATFEGGPRGQLARKYWIRYGIAFLTLQNSINYLTTGLRKDDEGNLIWDPDKALLAMQNPDPKHTMDIQIPDISIDALGGHNFGRSKEGKKLYTHFGKQALEIPRWSPIGLTTDAPFIMPTLGRLHSQAFSKSAPLLQLIAVQTFGGSPYESSMFPARGEYTGGRFKPWKGKKGWEEVRERAYEALYSSMPFSWQQIAQSGWATLGLTPLSKGSNLAEAEKYIEDIAKDAVRERPVFKAYWRGTPEQRLENLKAVLKDGGYNMSMVKSAIGRVGANYTKEYWQAAEKRNEKKMKELAPLMHFLRVKPSTVRKAGKRLGTPHRKGEKPELELDRKAQIWGRSWYMAHK